MANFEVSETYNNEIKKLEPTTPGHADNFNEIFQKLINNDAFIKKVAEQQLAIMQSHISNADDPHQEVFQTYYQQLVSYTDKAVADLINGAPETADTLRELADLIDKNKDVATALNEAIGKKANQTELDQAVSDISSLNRTFTTQIDDLNTNLVRVGNYKMIGQWHSANIDTSYTTEIENVTNYRFLLLGLKYGPDYLQTYFIPSHFAVNDIKSYNLYNSDVLAGNITFNSATSVTFTQNKLTYAPMEIYGVN